MAVTIDSRQFHDSVADIYFGPIYDTDSEGEGFKEWLVKDPRAYTEGSLNDLLLQYRKYKEEMLQRIRSRREFRKRLLYTN